MYTLCTPTFACQTFLWYFEFYNINRHTIGLQSNSYSSLLLRIRDGSQLQTTQWAYNGIQDAKKHSQSSAHWQLWQTLKICNSRSRSPARSEWWRNCLQGMLGSDWDYELIRDFHSELSSINCPESEYKLLSPQTATRKHLNRGKLENRRPAQNKGPVL